MSSFTGCNEHTSDLLFCCYCLLFYFLVTFCLFVFLCVFLLLLLFGFWVFFVVVCFLVGCVYGVFDLLFVCLCVVVVCWVGIFCVCFFSFSVIFVVGFFRVWGGCCWDCLLLGFLRRFCGVFFVVVVVFWGCFLGGLWVF